MPQKPVVLLVGDEPDTVRLVRTILQADGCQIIEASDGDDALALYRQYGPDLILLDKTALRRQNGQLRRELECANARIRHLVERFIPAQVMTEFMDSPEPPALGGKRQETTILYADLRGFSPLAESLPPDRLVEVLNCCLQLAADAIEAHGGTLDKFVGDGIIGLFNAPAPQPDHALRAVQAALDMVQAFQGAATLGGPFAVGVGINTGDVVVGNIGTPQLMNYTAIGDAMNLAERLQEAAGRDEILIGSRTYALAGEALVAEPLGLVPIRGHTEPVVTYRVKGIRLPSMMENRVAAGM